ncbi:hypothetical protein HRbin30_02116 [bacterium HR30]|nr:hypothetical protein HRbin30_02116 [bacterium HR30]
MVWNSDSHYSNTSSGNNATGHDLECDLRGLRCPMNWVRAKVWLETLPAGSVVRLRLDDARGARELPRAAEAEGYAVLDVVHDAKANEWQILLEK